MKASHSQVRKIIRYYFASNDNVEIVAVERFISNVFVSVLYLSVQALLN